MEATGDFALPERRCLNTQFPGALGTWVLGSLGFLGRSPGLVPEVAVEGHAVVQHVTAFGQGSVPGQAEFEVIGRLVAEPYGTGDNVIAGHAL